MVAILLPIWCPGKRGQVTVETGSHQTTIFTKNEKTQQHMKREYPEVYSWYRQALMKKSLSSFFDIYSDNERFKFWSGYLSEMKDLRADEEHGRLFLDFGTFGIIEFAAVGNAGYVYPLNYFRELTQKNFSSPTRHDDLKNQNQALHRIFHSKGWRNATRNWLNGREVFR